MKKFKKLEKKTYGEAVILNEGEIVQGIIVGTNSGKTKFGEAIFLELLVNGEKRSMIITAGLTPFQWDSLYGKEIQIMYKGFEKNPKTGRNYKSYDVFVEE